MLLSPKSNNLILEAPGNGFHVPTTNWFFPLSFFLKETKDESHKQGN